MDTSDISDRSKRWLAMACGLGFVVLVFAAAGALFTAGSIPGKEAPISEIVAFGRHRTALLTYGWLGPSAVLLMVLFVVFLARLAEPVGGTPSVLVVTAAVLLAAVDLINHTLILSLPDAAGLGEEAAAIVWFQLRGVDHVFHWVNPILFGGLAWLVWRTGVLPRVFAVVSALAAAADLLLGPAALYDASVENLEILPLFVLTLWVVAASAYLAWTAAARRSLPEP